MNPESSGSPFITLFMFLIWCVIIAVLSHLLAKEKGRNVALWTVLGAIPILNFIVIWYFVGAANLRLEQKIDRVIEALEKYRTREVA